MRIPLTLANSLLLLLAACLPGDKSAPPASSRPSTGGPIVVITGANRGLGLEFATQLHGRGATIIATARKPEKAKALHKLGVEIVKLDVTSDEDVSGLAKAIGDRHVDMLINNAGIMNGAGQISKIEPQQVSRMLDVNVIGPMRVTQALLPALMRGETRRIVNISSMLGSINRNGSGSFLGYRESKAALNMFTKSIAMELQDEGFTCIAMSPGWVRTDLGGSDANLSPEESISSMLVVIDSLTPDSTGGFFNYNGEQIEW